MFLTDTTATNPNMKAVLATVVARQGSNVTLECRGRKVSPIDTEVQWKFNGLMIKDDTGVPNERNFKIDLSLLETIN